MEYEGQYLTYEEYRGLGGTLDQTPFNILEFEARRRIDFRTQNRLKDSKEVPQEVKMCEYQIIENISSYNISKNVVETNGNISSVSTDGYSESYVTPIQMKDMFKSKEEELNGIIRTYLTGVIVDDKHIMFDGRDYVNQ